MLPIPLYDWVNHKGRAAVAYGTALEIELGNLQLNRRPRSASPYVEGGRFPKLLVLLSVEALETRRASTRPSVLDLSLDLSLVNSVELDCEDLPLGHENITSYLGMFMALLYRHFFHS